MVNLIAREAVLGRSERALPTVYQKHRFLQTRKWKYRS